MHSPQLWKHFVIADGSVLQRWIPRRQLRAEQLHTVHRQIPGALKRAPPDRHGGRQQPAPPVDPAEVQQQQRLLRQRQLVPRRARLHQPRKRRRRRTAGRPAANAQLVDARLLPQSPHHLGPQVSARSLRNPSHEIFCRVVFFFSEGCETKNSFSPPYTERLAAATMAPSDSTGVGTATRCSAKTACRRTSASGSPKTTT
jgi:hypothetical protein